jgi:hypothetical protein
MTICWERYDFAVTLRLLEHRDRCIRLEAEAGLDVSKWFTARGWRSGHQTTH